jgi:hypothetical protein
MVAHLAEKVTSDGVYFMMITGNPGEAMEAAQRDAGEQLYWREHGKSWIATTETVRYQVTEGEARFDRYVVPGSLREYPASWG